MSLHTLSATCKPPLPSLEYSKSAFKSNPVLNPLEQLSCAPSHCRVHGLRCLEPAEHCHCRICHTHSPHTCLPPPGSSWCLFTQRSTWCILGMCQGFPKHQESQYSAVCAQSSSCSVTTVPSKHIFPDHFRVVWVKVVLNTVPGT